MAGSIRPKFWRPGDAKPGESLSEERASTTESSGTAVVFNSNASLSMEQQRQRLPVFTHRTHILYLVEKFKTVIIIGETGSGKSTQIPQFLVEAGWGAHGKVICVTQPRRVACVTVATRVADERGTILGHEVGYAIRFEDMTDPTNTRVKFVTDGLLVREMMSDPLLSKYSVIMLDEAHERTLYTDIVIGLLKKIQRKRQDLRLIIASATLDAESFFKFFNSNETTDKRLDTAAILSAEGRMYPVDILYSLDPVPNYLKSTVETVIRIHQTEKEGDVLTFLTGMDEVETVVSMLVEEARKQPKDAAVKLRILPMYGGLPAGEQMKVFEKVGRNCRKVVVATNIAEASITIPGVVYVVDCGFVKLNAFNPASGIETLVIVEESQASATQRAGRAGRVRSGKAYRLFTEESWEKLPPTTVPEMQRSEMAGILLQLKALGIRNILRFDFLSPPPAQNMLRGLELLYALGSIDEECKLTSPIGMRMAEFPLAPMFAKTLLVSDDFDCSEEIVTIVAMMQIQNVFVTPSQQKNESRRAKRKFSCEEGDHLTMLNVYNAYIRYKKNVRWCHENFLNSKGLKRAVEIREQLCRLLSRFGVKMVSCQGDVRAICRCLTAGFFANAARLHYSREYRTVRDEHPLHIHPTSVLYVETPPTWVIFNEVVHTTKEYMRDITVIKPEWLYELAPHYYQYGTERELAVKRAKLD